MVKFKTGLVVVLMASLTAAASAQEYYGDSTGGYQSAVSVFTYSTPNPSVYSVTPFANRCQRCGRIRNAARQFQYNTSAFARNRVPLVTFPRVQAIARRRANKAAAALSCM